MRTIYDHLSVFSGKEQGFSVDRLAKKYAKGAAKIAYENNYDQHRENAADSRFMVIAKEKIAKELERRAESLNGHLPVISVFDALQIAKSAKDSKDMGLRNLIASLEKMWKKDRTANINAKTFLDLRDYYESNYPRSKVGKVFSEMGDSGYLNLPVADLIHLASKIRDQGDFEEQIRIAGLTTNRPDHVQARKFVLGLVNEGQNKQAQFDEDDEMDLVRSDMGDGGWSLHPGGYSDEDYANGIVPLLASGEAKFVNGEWNRPSKSDYNNARKKLEHWKSTNEGQNKQAQFDEEDDSLLRDLDLDGFRLRMWDAGEEYDRGQRRNKVRYELTNPEGEVIFSGDDYSPAPSYSIDGDDSVRGLLGFLTLKPGDTDDEYFENYSDIQKAFADEHAEGLSLWSDEGDDEYPAMDFQDWGGRKIGQTNNEDFQRYLAGIYIYTDSVEIDIWNQNEPVYVAIVHDSSGFNPSGSLYAGSKNEQASLEEAFELLETSQFESMSREEAEERFKTQEDDGYDPLTEGYDGRAWTFDNYKQFVDVVNGSENEYNVKKILDKLDPIEEDEETDDFDERNGSKKKAQFDDNSVSPPRGFLDYGKYVNRGQTWSSDPSGGRSTFISGKEDMDWLRSVHIPDLPDYYLSAIIVGSEDYPESIEVYESEDPTISDTPTIYSPEEELEEDDFDERNGSKKKAQEYEDSPIISYGYSSMLKYECTGWNVKLAGKYIDFYPGLDGYKAAMEEYPNGRILKPWQDVDYALRMWEKDGGDVPDEELNMYAKECKRKQAGSPGKFEGVPDELVDLAENLYDLAGNGMHDREAGESETTGWYAGFDPELAIIMEDSQGFIAIEVFDNVNDYEEAWEGIWEDTSSYDEHEEDDDYEGPESIMGYEASRKRGQASDMKTVDLVEKAVSTLFDGIYSVNFLKDNKYEIRLHSPDGDRLFAEITEGGTSITIYSYQSRPGDKGDWVGQIVDIADIE